MATQTPTERGMWSGKLGFVLAAAGSAIGLGNIWRFPYMAAEGGGGAFVLIYLGCVFFIGVPVLFAELTLGRATKRNPVGAVSLRQGKHTDRRMFVEGEVRFERGSTGRVFVELRSDGDRWLIRQLSIDVERG